MSPRALLQITLTASLLVGLGAAGCSLAKDEDTGSSPDEVVAGGDTSAVLKSTLILEGGCTAAKVGPRQLLVSARCVSGNAAFAVGSTIKFTSAASPTNGVVAAPPAAEEEEENEPTDAGAADASDAGRADSGRSDAGATDAGSRNLGRDLTVLEVKVHPSYAAKCKPAAQGQPEICGFNKLESSDSPDIAVIILEKDLDTVPSIPVDLDPVGQADPLLVVTSGCATIDGKAPGAPKTVKTVAVPAKSVNHKGSAYETSAQLVSRLSSSYVVTAGAGWRSSEPKLCKTDLSSPVFRGGSAAVAGITSNYTLYVGGKQPVTTHHTRVDAMSRFKIGAWLTDLGVETIHSCSETAGGCVKRAYDGGAPEGPSTDGPGDTTAPGDAGTGDATAPADGGVTTTKDSGTAEVPEEPTGPREETLPAESPNESYTEGEEDYSDAAAPKKKKKKEEGGCSAAPGGPAPTGEMFLCLGLGLGMAIVRRRRAKA